MSFVHRLAAREREPHAAITGQVVGTGQHEVAHARKTHERFLPGADGYSEAGHFHEPARDQRDSCIGAEAEPIRHAGADCQHIFHGATDLDADHVIRCIGAEVVARQRDREVLRQFGVICGDGQRGRQPRTDFLGERRARQYGHWPFSTEHIGRDLVWQHSGVQLEALGRPADTRSSGQPRADSRQCLAQAMARHGDQHVAHTVQTLFEIGGDNEVGRKIHAGQVSGIDAVARHGFELCPVSPPKSHFATAARELQCQRSSPGARADHSDCR